MEVVGYSWKQVAGEETCGSITDILLSTSNRDGDLQILSI